MAFQKHGFVPKSHKGKVVFYCPLCHCRQGTNALSKMTAWNHLQLAGLTVFVTLVFWSVFGVKGLFLYFIFWGGFEFFYRMRKREAVVCESCGFDPYLFVRDQQKARQALKKHWESRIETENLFVGKKLRNYKTKPLQPPVAEEETDLDALLSKSKGNAPQSKRPNA